MRLFDTPGPAKSDLHLHTSCSPDSTASPDDICRAAISRGLDAIAITDHVLFLDGAIRFKGRDCRSTETYKEIVLRTKARYERQLTVIFGVEVSYRSEKEKEIRDFLERGRFEFAIGSVHDSPPVNWWDPSSARILRERPDLAKKALAFYYSELQKAASTGWFDVIAHPDVYERYFPGQWPDIFQDPDLLPFVEAAVSAIAKHSRMEINLTTLHTLGEFPASTLPLVKMYREAGGKPPVVCTDAHSARWVGLDLDQGASLAVAAGFDSAADWRDVVPGDSA